MRLYQTAIMMLCLGWGLGLGEQASGAERPNVLWITSEDNSPYLGCYGDPQAWTPHLDQLAAEGVRYRHAFANAPVCSSARTTLITGMYATSLGAEHHRSRVRIPSEFELYPTYLRRAGYYCTNRSKTDYNLLGNPLPWDESSPRAHYRNRAAGQPFFAVINLTTTHESQVAPPAEKSHFRIPPEAITLPPYHPDTPEIRRDWANYYDRLTQMDQQVGEILAELDAAGLADDTIVFYYSDHGGALPRGKRNIHDSGTRVPLIIRIPARWQDWQPAPAGSWVDELVSFVDLPPTLLSLCGVAIPRQFAGRAFLGPARGVERTEVFLYRGRMDERYDIVRAVRDAEFRYVRNFSPHRPWGQHYTYPFTVQPSMRSWYDEYRAGRCNPMQAAYWEAKPAEELYRLADDPHELHNLAGDPQYAELLDKYRNKLRQQLLQSRDSGLIPEGMLSQLAGEQTIYAYCQSAQYPLAEVLELAEVASAGEVAQLPRLKGAMASSQPLQRYWGALGCLVLGEHALPARMELRTLLQDEFADVRVVAAEALCQLGDVEQALPVLGAVIRTGAPYEVLAAQNALDFLQAAQRIPLAAAQDLVRGVSFSEPNQRIPEYLLQLSEPGTK